MTPPVPPTVERPMSGSARAYEPSWDGFDGPINEEHRGITQGARVVAGAGESEENAKRYEMAYHNGSVMLEVGTRGGRGAVVALRGALRAFAGQHERPLPQYYGVDGSAEMAAATADTLKAHDLAGHGLLYAGDLASFHRDVPVTPTAVFLGGRDDYAGVCADLRVLTTFLAAGTSVFCHGYARGAARAIDECVASGFFRAAGRFGGGALLVTTDRCGGRAEGLGRATFDEVREGLGGLLGGSTLPGRADVRGVTEPARADIFQARARSQAPRRLGWPYEESEARGYPATLPGGKPWPKISVITPSYNYGQYIEQTILSVIRQDYPNLEYIVIDGGSKDDTPRILEKYRSHFAYVVSEKDRGQSHAINKGLSRATGEIITWVNSDDMLSPGALFAVALAFHESDADMVAGVCEIYRDEKLVERHLTSCSNGLLPLQDLLDVDNCWMTGQFFMQPEVMFRRSLWEKAGGRVDESLYYSMDYELWLRFAEAGAKVHVIGRPICRYRAHEAQKTASAADFVPELRKVSEAFRRRAGEVGEAGEALPWKTRMRVVFFNDIGFDYGAGIAHRRLAHALGLANHEVVAISGRDASVGGKKPVSLHALMAQIEGHRPDVVVLGNLHGVEVDPAVLSVLCERWPTIFVLHDQWAMTGRCAYTGDCTKYLAGCDHTCPTAGEYPPLAPREIAGAFKAKYQAYSGSNVPVLLGNSQWTASFARRALEAYREKMGGTVGISPVEVMRYGFELDVFKPQDKRWCRERLGLPLDKFIILTSASSVEDPRKGFVLLAEALKKLNLPGVTVASLGRTSEEHLRLIPSIHAMGYVKDPATLAMLNGAADLYVGPSREEAFGQVFIEAAACGTPSVGFRVGGVPDALVDGMTGYLADRVNADSLADVILELYARPGLRRDMAAWGRMHAENEWSMAASCHWFMTALGRTGVRKRIGLAPKISLRVEPPEQVAPVGVRPGGASWEVVSGFDLWEGPYPDMGLPRCRWLLGPVSKLSVYAPRTGRYKMLLRCTSLTDERQMRIVLGGRVVAAVTVPTHAADRPFVIECDVDLAAGTSPMEFNHWHWDVETPGRPMSVLFIDLALMPVDAAPAGAK